MKLKLLYFDLHLPYLLNGDKQISGGTSVEWLNWFNGLNKIGVDIELLTWKGAKYYIKKNHDIKIRESYQLNNGIRILRVLYYRIPVLYSAIKRSKATHIVQQNASWIAGIIAIISKLQKKKFILRIASDSDVNIIKSKNVGIIDKIGYWIAIKLSNQIFCQNQYQYHTFREKYTGKCLHILYNPIKIVNYKFNKYSERKYVGWIGKFTLAKNVQLLVEIVKALPAYNFKIVGQKTPNSRQIDLEAIVRIKKLNNIEIIDFIDRKDIFEYLNSITLLLNTSKYEGFSNTFLEALMVGTPIVTTSNVNPDNIISDNNLGFVANTKEEMIDYIKNTHKGFDYHSFYDHSHSFVKQNFDSVMQAKKFVSYLQ